jgi:hypothetical protein
MVVLVLFGAAIFRIYIRLCGENRATDVGIARAGTWRGVVMNHLAAVLARGFGVVASGASVASAHICR